MAAETLIRCLEEIIQRTSNPEEFAGFRSYLEKTFSSDTPSHERGIMDLNIKFICRFRSINPIDADIYDSLRKEAIAILEGMGYRTDILTSQEGALLGSSNQDSKNPYKPIGLLDGRYSLEEVIRARELAKISGTFGYFFEEPKSPDTLKGFNITLEPLDANGNTIRDPKPLDENLNPIENYRKSAKFPYRRD